MEKHDPGPAAAAVAAAVAGTGLRVPAAEARRAAMIVDWIRGVVFGQALADAYGLATEFMSAQEVGQRYAAFKDSLIPFHSRIQDGHRSRWRIGDWTDDTDQLILILQAFVDHSASPNPHLTALSFAARLKEWIAHGFPEFQDQTGMGIGFTVMTTVCSPNFLKDPHGTSLAVWNQHGRNLAANGAVMRTAATALPFFWDLEIVKQNTVGVAKVTHADPRCIASSLVVAVSIALLLQTGQDPRADREAFITKVLQESLTEVPGIDERELRSWLTKDLQDLRLDEPESIGYTYKCLGAAFWGFFEPQAPGTSDAQHFLRVIHQIAWEGGDADTNCAVAGALLGARIGYRNLPQDWLAQLPWKAGLDAKVDALLAEMGLLEQR